MDAKEKIKRKLIERINKLPYDKIEAITSYLDQLEETIQSKQSILGYSGLFKDLDQETLKELTEDLPKKRKDKDTRIPNF